MKVSTTVDIPVTSLSFADPFTTDSPMLRPKQQCASYETYSPPLRSFGPNFYISRCFLKQRKAQLSGIFVHALAAENHGDAKDADCEQWIHEAIAAIV